MWERKGLRGHWQRWRRCGLRERSSDSHRTLEGAERRPPLRGADGGGCCWVSGLGPER